MAKLSPNTVIAQWLIDHRSQMVNALAACVEDTKLDLTSTWQADWLQTVLDYLEEQQDKSTPCIAQLVDWAREQGQSLGEVLRYLRLTRKALVSELKEHSVAAPSDYSELFADLEDRQNQLAGKFFLQTERDRVVTEQRRQRSMADALDIAFVALNTEGKIRFANNVFARIAGTTSRAPRNQFLLDFCDEAATAGIKKALRSKQGKSAVRFKGAIQSLAGEATAVEIFAGPFFDVRGLRDGYAISMTLMNEDIQQEQGLIPLMYQNLSMLIPLATQVLDREGTILYENKASGKVMPQVTGAFCCHLMNPTHTNAKGCVCTQVFESGKAWQGDVPYQPVAKVFRFSS